LFRRIDQRKDIDGKASDNRGDEREDIGLHCKTNQEDDKDDDGLPEAIKSSSFSGIDFFSDNDVGGLARWTLGHWFALLGITVILDYCFKDVDTVECIVDRFPKMWKGYK
jgi:hypothetical protein